MTGFDALTGKAVAGEGHLRQSLLDLFRTAIGSRVCQREYGSLLPELVDQAMNGGGRLRLYAATAMAIARWEPRLRLTRVQLAAGDAPGAFQLVLEGIRTDLAAAGATRLTVPLPASA